jgi:hypothetical protein
MGRPAISEYQVKKAKKPNRGKVWHIVGRPNGQRIRAWFDSKEAAQAEATERNIAMRKLGQNAVSLDAVLAETARDGATRLKPVGKTLGEKQISIKELRPNFEIRRTLDADVRILL